MQPHPLIGISGSINKEETQHFLLRDYARAVLAGGGMPLMLLPDTDASLLGALLDRLDGLLLAGGNDVSPALFGETPAAGLGEVNPLRDAFEVRLICEAVRRRMPVLGICRGLQVMNVALGGTLWQDLDSQYQAPILHRQTCLGRYPCHTVRVHRDTLLGKLLAAGETAVNSFHHQALKTLAPCLRASAEAPDGVIEAAEHGELPFFVGVQWHPERTYEQDAPSLRIFSALADAAAAYRAKEAEA